MPLFHTEWDMGTGKVRIEVNSKTDIDLRVTGSDGSTVAIIEGFDVTALSYMQIQIANTLNSINRLMLQEMEDKEIIQQDQKEKENYQDE